MLEPYDNIWPTIDAQAFVHPSAVVIGKVTVGAETSLWPNTTLRGDDGRIVIGARTSIQDNTVCHLTAGLSELFVGDEVTCGHSVILHGCKIGNRVLVGMGAIVLDNAEVGELSLIGAGTLITMNTVIPPRSLVLGNPGKVVREVNEREITMILSGVAVYVEKARDYLRIHGAPKRR
ncbi:MAG: gamma carbonic anhydrase family protein [Deltaproteobacteria bacterium]|nr:gamma carbonic anhydrase family protein [Deltaproteobacteria bacterium]